jgi:DNA-directed RNA polymerase III subunit RPC1
VNAATCFRLLHDRFKLAKGDAKEEAKDAFFSLVASAASAPATGGVGGADAGLVAHARQRAAEELTPLRVLELFRAIPDADFDLLWLDRALGPPEALLVTHVVVPPVAIRPSVAMDAGGGSNEDDITMQLQKIVHINSALRLALKKGASAKMVQEDWDFLQVQAASMINGELPGLPPALKPKRPIRALAQRLKGKQGRFRGNLSGKRVDFSGRTVISPDPNLPLHAVGVPELVARVMTYPERVTALNLEHLSRAVANGGERYPGANAVRHANGLVRSLRFGDTAKVAAQLRVGDVVERHMVDGDVVLFNRQPSLHKMSIMAHRARVLPGRTFRFNECVCTPYNADFDGDEMNLHLPQTEEARAESAALMDVRSNMVNSRSGEPLIAAHQDFITAAWLLTQRDVLLDRDAFCQAAALLGDATEAIDMPYPAILKPVPLWTGKQIISLLLRPRKSISLDATFEGPARNWSKKGDPPVMCANDGYLVVRDAQLLAGNLDKESIGGGSKRGLVYVLIRDNSGRTAARALHRLTKLTSRWLADWGFSMGIEDVTPPRSVQGEKKRMVQAGYSACDEMIAEYRRGRLALQAGCDEEQSLEALLNGTLSRLRDSMGGMCMAELPRLNPPRVMATSGSKGSVINISQMVACESADEHKEPSPTRPF